jgi:hypothetical protein
LVLCSLPGDGVLMAEQQLIKLNDVQQHQQHQQPLPAGLQF